jgi:3alpha(or 20beta)-hydroxysteroid dehydrogenase
MGRLTKKIAFVSGGSRGMGAAHARAIVANDGKVVIGDILEAEGAALARELGDGARFIRLEISRSMATGKLLSRLRSQSSVGSTCS